MSRLAAKALNKSYKKRHIVKNVSLHVNTGEIVGLLGRNGAGKTTSFYLMVGLINADSGDILLDQQNITHYPMHARAKLGIGYLPQEPSVFRKLSVADNLRAVLQIDSSLSVDQIELSIDDLLSEFGIEHLRNQIAIGLSGGERRRLEIARAIATKPKFILLDEPFAAVDLLSIIDLQQIIQQLRERNIGILITEHHVRETLEICDRAYIVNEGKVFAEGEPSELAKNKEVREVFLGERFNLNV